MDWAPCLFEQNKSIMLSAFCIADIGKGKGFCYIIQMHCKCLVLTSLMLCRELEKQMHIEKKKE